MEDRKLAILTERAQSGMSRRDFMRSAATAGLSVAMASGLWTEAQAMARSIASYTAARQTAAVALTLHFASYTLVDGAALAENENVPVKYLQGHVLVSST